MKNKSKIKFKILAFALTMIMLFSSSMPVMAFNNTDVPYAGSGTVQSPYLYVVPSSDSASWKSLVDLRYPFVSGSNFSAERTTPLVKTLEIRQGNVSTGQLLYSWTFNGNSINSGLQSSSTPTTIPYFENKKCPYYLGITEAEDTAYDSGLPTGLDKSSALFLKMDLKYDLYVTNTAVINYKVGNHFSNGQNVDVYFYGGNDAANHGDGVVDEHAPAYVETGVEVVNGYVEFTITHGGNYVLIPE